MTEQEELSVREKRIYLAGYVDGDGSIVIEQSPSAGRKAYRLMLDVSSINSDIIDWLLENYSGRVTDGNKYHPACRLLKQWRVYSRDAYKLIHNISPYLLLKDRQAELAMEYYLKCERWVNKGKLRPSWLIRRQEEYHAQMHALNKRGKHSDSLVPELKPDMLNNREALIYFAALIDSEGTINIYHTSQPSKNYYAYLLLLSVSNTDSRMIDWLVKKFSGYTRWTEFANDNWKNVKRWTVWGDNACNLLKRVRPFLIVKTKQADLAIEFYRKCITNTGKRPQWRKDKAYDYYLQMKKLNTRGPISDNEEDSIPSDNASHCTQLSLSSFV